jgi:hypothetical protein
MNKILIALIGIVPACLTAYLGYLGGVKQTSANPPTVQIDQAAETAPESPSVDWTHKTFTTGALAAAYLSLATEQPNPKDVYATLSGGNTFHVWWKATRSRYTYSYRYVLWNPREPDKVPLPALDPTQIPIGFGGSGGRTVFVFFEAAHQQ